MSSGVCTSLSVIVLSVISHHLFGLMLKCVAIFFVPLAFQLVLFDHFAYLLCLLLLFFLFLLLNAVLFFLFLFLLPVHPLVQLLFHLYLVLLVLISILLLHIILLLFFVVLFLHLLFAPLSFYLPHPFFSSKQ